MYKIKNTANDRSKTLLHRTAIKFELEPSFAGVRLRLGESRDIEDAVYERNKELLDRWEKNGMISIERPGSETTVPGLPGDPGLAPPTPPPPPQEEAPVASDPETAKELYEALPDAAPVTETTPESDAAPEAPSVPIQSRKGPGKKKLY